MRVTHRLQNAISVLLNNCRLMQRTKRKRIYTDKMLAYIFKYVLKNDNKNSMIFSLRKCYLSYRYVLFIKIEEDDVKCINYPLHFIKIKIYCFYSHELIT